MTDVVQPAILGPGERKEEDEITKTWKPRRGALWSGNSDLWAGALLGWWWCLWGGRSGAGTVSAGETAKWNELSLLEQTIIAVLQGDADKQDTKSSKQTGRCNSGLPAFQSPSTAPYRKILPGYLLAKGKWGHRALAVTLQRKASLIIIPKKH